MSEIKGYIMKQSTWMWITFLFEGVFMIYIGYILSDFELFNIGIFFIVGSIVSLYYLYALDNKNSNKKRK